MLVVSLFPVYACKKNPPEESSTSTSQEPIIGTNASMIMIEDNVALRVGESYTLKYNVYPENSVVEWISMNPEIASVENGVITGVAFGKTQIIASIGEFDKAICTVDIKANADAAYQIELSRTDLRLFMGETFLLTATLRQGATICADDGIIWSTSNSLVVSVNEIGEITPRKYGEATITASYKTPDGKIVSANCVVEILDNYLLEIAEAANGIMVYPGESFTLTPSVYNENREQLSVDEKEYIFSSANEDIVACKNGVFKAIGSGMVEVFVEYRGHVSVCMVTVWGLQQEDFVMVSGKAGTSVQWILNEGFYYQGNSEGVTENYFIVGGESWREFITVAESKGYEYIEISVYQLNGILAMHSCETEYSLLGGEKGETLRTGEVSGKKPFVNRVKISECKSWTHFLIGMYGSGNFSFTINLE